MACSLTAVLANPHATLMSCSAVRQGAVQVITRRTQSLSTSCYRDRRDNKRRAVAAAAAAAGHAGSHGSSVQLFGAPTPERGFLPEIDPNLRLPLPLKDYEDALDALPKLALGRRSLLSITQLSMSCANPPARGIQHVAVVALM